MALVDKIRIIEGFPKEGISFKDITTLLLDPEGLRESIDKLAEYAAARGAELIVGTEARGFIVGTPVAYKLGVGFVPVRKPGKLPGRTISYDYELEYGTDTLEIDADAIKPGTKVVLMDDLIATGGTALAAIKLLQSVGAEVVGAGFIIELTDLGGRELLGDTDMFSLVSYEH